VNSFASNVQTYGFIADRQTNRRMDTVNQSVSLLVNGDKPVHFLSWWVPPHTLNSVPLQNGSALHVPQAVFTQIQFGHPSIVLWIGALVPHFNFKLPYFNVFCTFNMR